MKTPTPMSREEADRAAYREYKHAIDKNITPEGNIDWPTVAGWMTACLSLALEGAYIPKPKPNEEKLGSPKP